MLAVCLPPKEVAEGAGGGSREWARGARGAQDKAGVGWMHLLACLPPKDCAGAGGRKGL